MTRLFFQLQDSPTIMWNFTPPIHGNKIYKSDTSKRALSMEVNQ